MTKTKIKAGDRVFVYGANGTSGLGPYKCTVIAVESSLPCGAWVTVRWPSGDTRKVHSKQCRRLVTKPARRVWIDKSKYDAMAERMTGVDACVFKSDASEVEWLEFKEVRPAHAEKDNEGEE